MKVAVVTKPYTVEIQEFDRPVIGSRDVLIKTVCAGICGSDLHLYKGTHAFRKPPAPLGHEISGEVVAVGEGVKNIAIGDRVTVEPQITCGECLFCKSGANNLCTNKVVPGTPAWLGTFAEFFAAPEQTVYKLNDNVSYETGALVEPLAVAVQAVNAYTGTQKGNVAILGSGTIGLLALAVCKARGYGKVYCTDTAPFNRELALRMGAAAAYDPLSCDVVQIVKEETGCGVDMCIVAAGAPNIIDQASALTRKRGDIVLVSMITASIPVYTYGLVFNEQKLIGTMTYTTKAFQEAAELINNGLSVSDVITHSIPMADSIRGLEILDKKTENSGKILVRP